MAIPPRPWCELPRSLGALPRLPQPQAAAGIGEKQGHRAPEQFAVGPRHEVVKEDNLLVRVRVQERVQATELVPGPVFRDRPLLRVLERVEDVVEVDEDAGPQPGQHARQVVRDVAPGLHDVCRVDEQDVAAAEAVVHLGLDVLHTGLHDLDLLAVLGPQQAFQAVCVGGDEQAPRRLPQPALDDVERGGGRVS